MVAGAENESAARPRIAQRLDTRGLHVFRFSAQHDIGGVNVAHQRHLLAARFFDFRQINVAHGCNFQRVNTGNVRVLHQQIHQNAVLPATVQQRWNAGIEAHLGPPLQRGNRVFESQFRRCQGDGPRSTEKYVFRFDPLRELSRKICIICGGIELSDDYGVYNSAFMFEDGFGRSIHRKIYLPTYGMFEELRYFSAGQQIKAVTSKRLGRIGMAICEDFWHVSVPYLLAHQGAKLLFVLMSSPLRMSPGDGNPSIVTQWQTITSTYSFLFSSYVACVNRVGNEDSFTYWGNSSLTGPEGTVLCAAPLFKPHVMDAELDVTEVKRARLHSSHFLDEDLRLIGAELNEIIAQGRRG